MTLSASLHKRLPSGFSLEANMVLDPGITILFGESGSGKTTLLRCLAGLLDPDAGRVVLGDRIVHHSDSGVNVPPSARGIGFVFQDLALFPHLTARENIGYGLASVDGATRRSSVDAIAESFRIADLLNRRPREISGGERQRVALARSLVTNPELLLLDEPLSALDLATQSRIIADLRAWNAARRIPILYVTHSHREVFALGERVIVLQQGRLIADGTPHEVLDTPAHELVAQLAGFENIFDAVVTTLRPEAGTMECRLMQTDTEIEVPLGRAKSGDLTRVAIRAGDIIVATERPREISARNVLPGIVRATTQQGTTVMVLVEAGPTFEVHVTPIARESLRLEAGRAVWLVIKTHSCRLVS